MGKKILMLTIISILFLNCSINDEKQNLDINVTGKVVNQNDFGMEGVKIYVQRGKVGYYAATNFETYEILTTNASGNYNYIVKNDTYVYRICCGVPTGYIIVGDGIKNVNHNITNGQTIQNVINFKLTQ